LASSVSSGLYLGSSMGFVIFVSFLSPDYDGHF
jgi:hypothetical protein